MDFISADRTKDSEFEAGLKNYNFGVAETNKEITRAIDNDRDTEKKTERDIDSAETFTQIKNAGGQATGLASATATFKNYQEYGEKMEQAAKKAQKVASQTAEKIQQVKPTTETPPDQLGGKVAEEADEGGALTDAGKAGKVAQAESDTLEALNKGGKVGGAIGKAGTAALKGVGVIGSIAGMGMAIASDENGGWAKKSLADKIGNAAEIGGAGLDIVGTALEFTPLAPIGLALQGLGTVAQIGAGIEGEISSEKSVDPAKKEAQQQEQQEEKDEGTKGTQIASVSEAQAGGLGVSRQQQ